MRCIDDETQFPYPPVPVFVYSHGILSIGFPEKYTNYLSNAGLLLPHPVYDLTISYTGKQANIKQSVLSGPGIAPTDTIEK